ncbi:MAG TPA: Flp pilus assembly protein CpaB [Candidatus Dormibacteraeota bacterium]|nr:Flp pilus assembly protein CpaB [Candidatus Dormibacteraeota bacterium]
MRTFSAITSRRPFTLLGILLALLVIVAFVLVALNASAANISPQQTVVYAARTLQARVPISASDLSTKPISVPATYPKVYFTDPGQVQGMVPLVAIQQGQAITSNDVAKPSQALGSQSEYLPIPQGYVALTIPTSEQQGVADYIQPGDYISVIATVSSGSRVASMTIFTQLHVIKVGTQSAAGGASATSLTVVVTQCQAEVITWFLTYASLKYTLESYKDYAPGAQAPDPKCPSVGDAKGVTLAVIKAAFPGLF